MAQVQPGDTTGTTGTIEDQVKGLDATVRDNEEEVTPDYDTHSFDTVDLLADDVDVIIRDALYPMGDGEIVNDDVVREFSSKLINDFGEDHAYISENNIQMLALLQENGHLSEDELRAYIEGSNAERLNIMKTSITNWLDDPNAGGKDTLVANMCVESMLGDDLVGNNAVRALEIQSSDILFGSTKDGHINTFFYNGLKGDTLYAANNILENMYAKGDITEDQYFEACESWESKMMSMAACGNNIIEMMAARDALRTDYENEHSQTPEEAMREFCEKQGWDYEEFINGMQNPETWDGTDNTKKDAYRFPLVNGEWPKGTDDKYKDAYEIMMLDNAMGETEEEAQVMEDTLREALHAGINAFKDILTRSEVGQKILMICNNFVHSEPINGTLFQEIWDLEDVNADTYETFEMTTPTPTPTSDPGPEESEIEESEAEESEAEESEAEESEAEESEAEESEAEESEAEESEAEESEAEESEAEESEAEESEAEESEVEESEVEESEAEESEAEESEVEESEIEESEIEESGIAESEAEESEAEESEAEESEAEEFEAEEFEAEESEVEESEVEESEVEESEVEESEVEESEVEESEVEESEVEESEVEESEVEESEVEESEVEESEVEESEVEESEVEDPGADDKDEYDETGKGSEAGEDAYNPGGNGNVNGIDDTNSDGNITRDEALEQIENNGGGGLASGGSNNVAISVNDQNGAEYLLDDDMGVDPNAGNIPTTDMSLSASVNDAAANNEATTETNTPTTEEVTTEEVTTEEVTKAEETVEVASGENSKDEVDDIFADIMG